MAKGKWALLAVDDDAGVRQSLKLWFDGIFEYHSAGTPAEAMECLRLCDTRLAVAVVDLRLSDGDNRTGLNLVHQIQAEAPNAQIVVYSGWIDVPNCIELHRLGVWDIVEKPDPARLLDRVKAAPMPDQPRAELIAEPDGGFVLEVSVTEPPPELFDTVQRAYERRVWWRWGLAMARSAFQVARRYGSTTVS